ncbi:hypothetical protein SS1G_13338 [Sclerotinia sclerotiorum 1980 UF-70]|uniref:Small ribosomal subunit protein uS4m n=2 Tax=Sclerotinia sclerotiorum (strain ATCC 18683 / 1980 / Ss-1) TaxID=665079 RepID=A7F6V8_SCLS1|nr:hypothetical protein SS1G_13338 [Sclerotinia sclerotiorum 1980 UF-70]APA08396.1 hypothetical protein sscle_03g031660 [Sclerotinia sclerotiorum 1980 UF-70]EDN98479.1 hypothetical protein SS1G_13338 [Sclerotinia sclerotiorum 1980 UF-70]
MRSRFHQLKKVKIRQTWNKINLYNLSRYKPRPEGNTFFQQKWKAKSLSRAYHGEQIREGQWTRMFRPRAKAVIPMDYKYLAEHDGSELAAGRGSGLEILKGAGSAAQFNRNQIPYMSMVYAPIERRLDTAIFRALFASSTRQARQFVVHGKVKVNGKKMPYPGYLLNPGDMFQVDIDRVLFATGAPKTADQIKSGRGLRRSLRAMNDQKAKNAAAKKEKEAAAAAAREEGGETTTPKETPESKEKDEKDRLRMEFRTLQEHADILLTDSQNSPSGKRKIALRKLKREVRATLSQLKRTSVADLTSILNSYTTKLAKSEDLETIAAEARAVINAEEEPDYREKLKFALQRAKENPIDESKPYMTPWQPRPYMSAFAFIPRYLEVNQKICGAVYLRHPVARPGLSEVPSPFSMELLQLAHNWYLRRR